MKSIGSTGLAYLWEKIKSYVSGLGFYTKPSTGIPATDIANGVIPTVPTTLSAFTDDLGSSPTHTHSQYMTSAPVTSVNGQTGAVTVATGENNVIESVTFNGTAATVTNKTAAITATIPTITFREW